MSSPPAPPQRVKDATKQQRLRQKELVTKLKKEGLSGEQLHDELTAAIVDAKRDDMKHKCERCWHDKSSRCICASVPQVETKLQAKALIVIHYKEWYSAGDDAKLIKMMTPNNADVFVFGMRGEMDRLRKELEIDPQHNVILWPADDALTIDTWKDALPETSSWKQKSSSPQTQPLLRVVVLDGVYQHARHMFKYLKTHLHPDVFPPFVALKPEDISVYHRAQKKYGESDRERCEKKGDEGIRICTVEAYALLLKSLGEDEETTKAMVKAVVTNNEALKGDISVRPESGKASSASSGAAKRRRQKEGERVHGRHFRQLNEANYHRIKSPKPALSSFNVAATIRYIEARSGAERTVTGVNSEPCSLSGSICAERAALANLREDDIKEINSVSIVSDSVKPITPGLLCREYMSSRFSRQVLDPQKFDVVLAGSKGEEVDWDSVIVMKLAELFPAVPVHLRGRRVADLDFDELRGLICKPCLPEFDEELYEKTLAKAKSKINSAQHPSEQYFRLSFAAGIRFSDEECAVARQYVGLEYGTSVDPIAALAVKIEEKLEGECVIKAVIVVDELGVAVAPFAVGRAFLSELGKEATEGCMVFYHAKGKKDGGEGNKFEMKVITLDDLVPGLPEFDVGDLNLNGH
ncbi:hypothetical protein TrLO_g14437 [Triparma laevis f. longispina]|uniref:tRNA-uridine aminocarboxypropyltransferase n=1 Tax=Triparma laevis f. longispina TaxID=1714387 RepID=A0A9W7ADE0_9STRA|nr:hypothetical protein TrLO_g14437 [Triparma laevis f. longispina]